MLKASFFEETRMRPGKLAKIMGDTERSIQIFSSFSNVEFEIQFHEDIELIYEAYGMITYKKR